MLFSFDEFFETGKFSLNSYSVDWVWPRLNMYFMLWSNFFSVTIYWLSSLRPVTSYHCTDLNCTIPRVEKIFDAKICGNENYGSPTYAARAHGDEMKYVRTYVAADFEENL